MGQVKIKKVETKWGNFTLISAHKVSRVIDGKTNNKGEMIAGLGTKATDEELLVAYDKEAGLIRGKENAKVKTGCFWNVKEKKAQENPKVIYIYRLNKKTVEVPADKELPLQVRAVQAAAKEEKKEAAKKAKK